MIHNNLRSASPPPEANTQYPGTDHLGNNFSTMPGVNWYNDTTAINPGQFRIKGPQVNPKGGKRKTKKNHIGGNQTILKGNNNYGISIDGQTPSEIKEFGLLPGNDWGSSLGESGGIVAQINANAGGKKKKTKKTNKQKKGGRQNIPIDIKTNISPTQQWSNPNVQIPLPQYQGGIFTGPPAFGPWGFIPVTPTTSNMIHNNLRSASPPPEANTQYPGTNRLGNNFSTMPGINWYNNTTDMNPGQFRIKGPIQGGQRKSKKKKKGGYSSLGFQTYPSYCDGKENWSQCGINSTVCNTGGKKKRKKKKKK
jgi:hypothetical protein